MSVFICLVEDDEMRCGIGLKALTLASAVFAFLCILFPVVLKAINDANRPLMCYQCWAARNLEKTAATNGSIVQGVWDRPWCLSEQTSADIPVDTVVCQPSERYCGIYYHERKDLNRVKGGDVTAIFVRGCQEDETRPSLFIGTMPSALYGNATGHLIVDVNPVRNISHVYMAWDQACTTPLCNSWKDHLRSWTWIDWLKEAYSFR